MTNATDPGRRGLRMLPAPVRLLWRLVGEGVCQRGVARIRGTAA